MRTLIGILLLILLLLEAPRHASASVEAEKVDFCELIENPAKYSGSRVSVTAVYSYGYEWQELVCMECRSRGKTWLAFHPDAIDQVRKQLKRAPRHQGIISGRFTGVFHGSGGPYGDGSFRFEFEVEQIAEIKVLVRDWKTPLDRVAACKSTTPHR